MAFFSLIFKYFLISMNKKLKNIKNKIKCVDKTQKNE